MNPEANKALVRRYYDEVWSQGRLGFVDEHMAEDYENCDPTTPGKVLRGRDAFRALVTAYREALPDLRMDVLEQHAEGAVVVTRWSASGTQRGALMGVPPTGRYLEGIEGVTTTYFERGRIVRDRAVWDALGMLRGLGADVEASSTESRNIETVKALYAAFGRDDMAGVLDLLDDDVSWGIDSVAAAEVPPYGILHGKASVPSFFSAWGDNTVFHDFNPHEFHASGDHVFNLLAYDFTVKATGKRVSNLSPQHWTLRNGRIVRWRGYEDTAATRDGFRK